VINSWGRFDEITWGRFDEITWGRFGTCPYKHKTCIALT
jgi:hypothetical protein